MSSWFLLSYKCCSCSVAFESLACTFLLCCLMLFCLICCVCAAHLSLHLDFVARSLGTFPPTASFSNVYVSCVCPVRDAVLVYSVIMIFERQLFGPSVATASSDFSLCYFIFCTIFLQKWKTRNFKNEKNAKMTNKTHSKKNIKVQQNSFYLKTQKKRYNKKLQQKFNVLKNVFLKIKSGGNKLR